MEQRDLSSTGDFWGDGGGTDAPSNLRRPRASAYRRPFALRVLRVPDRWIPGSGAGSRSRNRQRSRPSARADRSAGRTRPVAAAVLLAALTLAWLAAGHRSRAAGSNAAPAAPSSVPASRSPERVRLDVRSYPPGTGAAAYRRATGVAATPHTGPAACARGAPEERSWSRPGAPTIAVGRYRCVLEHGRAAMWWTRGDRVSHAVAANGDLAALFAWWRAHPEQ
jgi:hypothetical protein